MDSLGGLDDEEAKNQVNDVVRTFWSYIKEIEKLKSFSKGNQQKIQFILSLLHDPELIIMDEPFTGLDPLNQLLLKEIIQEKQDEGKTIIFLPIRWNR